MPISTAASKTLIMVITPDVGKGGKEEKSCRCINLTAWKLPKKFRLLWGESQSTLVVGWLDGGKEEAEAALKKISRSGISNSQWKLDIFRKSNLAQSQRGEKKNIRTKFYFLLHQHKVDALRGLKSSFDIVKVWRDKHNAHFPYSCKSAYRIGWLYCIHLTCVQYWDFLYY